MASEEPSFQRNFKRKHSSNNYSKKMKLSRASDKEFKGSSRDEFLNYQERMNVSTQSDGESEDSSSEFQSLQERLKLSTESDDESEYRSKYTFLSYQNILEGMVILGCVVEIRKNFFICSLPGCLHGKVPFRNISDKFSEILLDNNRNTEEKKSIIKLGMVFPCKVMSITAKFGKTAEVILSINPRDVNENLNLNSCYYKMILYASITSVEDHGYILDIGIPGLKGFIQSNQLNGEELSLGEVVPVFVKKTPKKSCNVLQLSKLRFDETFPMIEKQIKLSSILPGSCINAYVTEVKHPFVLMTFQSFNVCATALTLKKPEKLFCEIFCKVLYVHPLTQVIYVSFETTPAPETFSNYFGFKQYDFVENVNFQFWHENQGCCSFGKACFGFFQKEDLEGNKSLSLESLNANRKIPRARVVSFHYMDNLVELSIKESWLARKIISPEEIQIGNIFQGIVKKHLPFGMFVNICPGFTGCVKRIYMSDVHVTKPEKLFPVGAKVKCRVVALVPNGKPHFTCKDSLINLPSSAMLASYEEAHKGMLIAGVVQFIDNCHASILFFQHVEGILPLESLPKDCVLFNGQTIVCEIVSCDTEKKCLKLSFKSIGLQSLNKSHETVDLSKDGKELKKKMLNINQNSSVDYQLEEGSLSKALMKRGVGVQLNLV